MSEAEILDRYDVVKEIGQGGFSKVYLGVDKETKKEVAIKIISKSGSQNEASEVKKEVIIQREFESPYIVNIMAMAERADDFILVMEYVNGGELFDAIVNAGSFSESDAANMIQQVLVGLKLLHDNGVVHRDLKPENLLLSVDDKGKTTVKIADFGLSGLIDNTEDMKKFCGTEGYAAPEIVKNIDYDSSVDMWSLGVIVYILLSGFKPFDSDSPYELYQMVITADYEFFSPEFDEISDEAKDFISKLLQPDPKNRMTANDALKHPWIIGNAPQVKLDSLNTHLRAFNAKRKMRRALIQQLTKVRFANLCN